MSQGLISRFPTRHLKAWRQQDLPGSWMTLSRICPALGPRPGRRIRPARHVDAAPASVTTKAPDQYQLSRLNHAASAIATYASPPQVTPRRARLASGCRPGFTGWELHPQDHFGWFQDSISSFPLPQALPGATQNSIISQTGGRRKTISVASYTERVGKMTGCFCTPEWGL